MRPTALVLRALGLGDLLVAVPALRLVRAAFPGHRVVLAAPAALAPLVVRIDAVDEHLPCPSPDDLPTVARERDLDGVAVAINLHGRGPQSHAALDALRPHRRVGHAAPGWDGPAWTDDPRRPERRRWCDLLAATGLVTDAAVAAGTDDLRLLFDQHIGTHVVVHPGAAFGAKRWPVERFAAVARALRDQGHDVVVTGGPDERALTAPVAAASGGDDRAGRTDLAELVDLVARARLVVSGDTGVAHLATAFGVPSVTLFGPVGPEQWGPPADGPHVALTDATRRRGERFAEDPDPALLAVTVDDVLTAAALVPAREDQDAAGRCHRP